MSDLRQNLDQLDALLAPADRTKESDRTFQQRLQQWETRAAVDVAGDVVQERVARAICLAAYHGQPEWIWDRMGSPLRDDYLRLAAAALAAMPPVDETLRELLTWLAVEGYEVKTEDTDGPGLTPAEVLARYTDAIGGAR